MGSPKKNKKRKIEKIEKHWIDKFLESPHRRGLDWAIFKNNFTLSVTIAAIGAFGAVPAAARVFKTSSSADSNIVINLTASSTRALESIESGVSSSGTLRCTSEPDEKKEKQD